MNLMAVFLKFLVSVLYLISCEASGGDAGLTSNTERPCPGDNLVFTCNVSGVDLTWRVVNGDNTLVALFSIDAQSMVNNPGPLDSIAGFTSTLQSRTGTSPDDVTKATLTTTASAQIDQYTIMCADIVMIIGQKSIQLADKPAPPSAFENTIIEVATAESAIVSISWTPPDNNGGADIDNYTVNISPSTQLSATVVTSTTVTVTADYGVDYTLSVVATNCAGSSDPALYNFSISRVPTIVSSLQFQRFACPGQPVTYRCSGPGLILDWFAPPFIPSIAPVRYLIRNVIGTGFTAGPITTILISFATKRIVADLTVAAYPGVSGLDIFCSTGFSSISLTQVRVRYQLSDPPPPPSMVMLSTSAVFEDRNLEIAWEAAVPGNYDIESYVVKTYINGVLSFSTEVSGTSVATNLEGKVGDVLAINVSVSTKTECNQTSAAATASTTVTLAGCPLFTPPSNGSIDPDPSGMLGPGATVTLSCNQGFMPTGPTTVVCTVNLMWFPDPNTFVCVPVTTIVSTPVYIEFNGPGGERMLNIRESEQPMEFATVEIIGQTFGLLNIHVLSLTYKEFEAQVPGRDLNDIFPTRPLPADSGDFQATPQTTPGLITPMVLDDSEAELNEGYLLYLLVEAVNPLDDDRIKFRNDVLLVNIEDDDSVECSGNVGDNVATVVCEDLTGEIDLLCSIDFGPPEPCLLPLTLPLREFSPGRHNVRVIRTVQGEPIPDEIIGGTLLNVEPLEVYFINNTPVLTVDRLVAEFRASRPNVTLECHVTYLDFTREDCSSGRFDRSGIPPGDYTLRVIARDPSRPLERRAVARNRIWVHGDDVFCITGTQNRGLTIDGNTATVEFYSTGVATGFRCVLDRMEIIENCISPYTIRGLSLGRHHFKVIPTCCERPYRAITLLFNIN